MTTFNEILSAAQSLPTSDRVRLIDALWDTVPLPEWTPPSEEWLAEIERRSAEVDAGRMPVAPWPEVKQRARQRITGQMYR